MIQQPQIDTVKELLEIAKELIPLLTNKNIDKAIAGIAEAKQVIATKNEIMLAADKAAGDAAQAKSLLEKLTEEKKLLHTASESIATAEASVKQREAALKAEEDKIQALNTKAQQLILSNEKKAAQLTSEIEASKAEQEIAAALRAEFNEKLKLVKAL